jgi:hypothetical protein
MTEEHLSSLLAVAEAGKKDKDGWLALPEGRHITFYCAYNGASLSVSRVSHLSREGELISARTVKGETFVLALSDIFAGAVEAPAGTSRKAGFV